MAKILLVNSEEESRARLAAFLRVERHEVHVPGEKVRFTQMVKHYGSEIDLVILDASHDEKYVFDFLAEIASFWGRNGPRPSVLCISRVYRGPRFELEVERKGARLIYV